MDDGKRAHIMTQKCVSASQLRSGVWAQPLLLLTSSAWLCCPHARLALCKCLVQTSTADTLYLGKVTDSFSVLSFEPADDQ